MSEQELHAFGIEIIVSHIEKEGVIIEDVNPDLKSNPQIIGQRWGSLAFSYVRTACYPQYGTLSNESILQCLHWAYRHSARAFFASVGIACMNYPDKTLVQKESDRGLPIRNGGFAAAYEGLHLITWTDISQLHDNNNSEPE